MDHHPDLKNNQIISYLYLRMLIGACGFVLPLFCLIYGMIYGIQDSISDYYYTSLRNVFEGILFVLGFFLLTYKGYDSKDNRFANLGFLFALGVALCPCNYPRAWVRITHFTSAFLLFSVFIYFSLRLFTLSVKCAERTRERILMNRVYVACGWIMIFCIAGIGLGYWLLTEERRVAWNTTFWFESVALVAFAISWLTKGHFYQESSKLFGKVRTSFVPLPSQSDS